MCAGMVTVLVIGVLRRYPIMSCTISVLVLLVFFLYSALLSFLMFLLSILCKFHHLMHSVLCYFLKFTFLYLLLFYSALLTFLVFSMFLQFIICEPQYVLYSHEMQLLLEIFSLFLICELNSIVGFRLYKCLCN